MRHLVIELLRPELIFSILGLYRHLSFLICLIAVGLYALYRQITKFTSIIQVHQMHKADKKSKRKVSCNSTEADSSSEKEDYLPDPQSIKDKYKTQLCKNFEVKGKCPYGPRCRFAHGAKELVPMDLPDCFRRKKCKGFWEHGFCSYGSRCQFAHEEGSRWESKGFLLGINSILEVPAARQQTRLLTLLSN